MNSLKDSIYFQINSKVWELFKSSLPAKGSDEAYWDSVLAKGQAICEEYESTSASQYCRDLIMATINELDRLSKLGNLASFKTKPHA